MVSLLLRHLYLPHCIRTLRIYYTRIPRYTPTPWQTALGWLVVLDNRIAQHSFCSLSLASFGCIVEPVFERVSRARHLPSAHARVLIRAFIQVTKHRLICTGRQATQLPVCGSYLDVATESVKGAGPGIIQASLIHLLISNPSHQAIRLG